MTFDLTILGQKQMEIGFSRFAGAVEDWRPAWPQVVTALRGILTEQFDTEGAHGGKAWAPLSPAYAAWKAQHYPGRPILVLTGQMRSSLTGGRGVVIPERHELTFGTPVSYARYHQTGTPRMPSRPIFALTDDDQVKVGKAMHAHMVNEAKRLGLL